MIRAIYGLACSPFRHDLFYLGKNVPLIDILSASYGSIIDDKEEST